MKKLNQAAALACSALLAGAALAVPTVTITNVQQQYPWENGVVVTYTVADAESGYGAKFYATINNAVREVASLAALADGAGQALTWTPEADLKDTEAVVVAKVVKSGEAGGAKTMDDLYAAVVANTTAGEYLVVCLTNGYTHYETCADPAKYQNDEYRTVKMALRRIPAGSYPISVGGNNTNCQIVATAKDFYFGIFPVTAAQYALMSDRTATVEATADNLCPAVMVSWAEIRGTNSVATSFGGGLRSGSPLHTLNQTTGLTFDLPTEAMWDIAARAGTTTKWFFGSSSTALINYAYYDRKGDPDAKGLKGSRCRVVGSKLPNQWGIYDVYGNTWQWCLDLASGDYEPALTVSDVFVPLSSEGVKRRIRGGSFYNAANECSSSARCVTSTGPNDKDTNLGFRLALIVQ